MKSGYKETQNIMRQQTAMKNFRYNRFLLLRYFFAIFFFANLYWFLALFVSRSLLFSMLPVCLMVISILVIAEHVKLYGEKSDQMNNKLRYNLFYHYIQIAVNTILILITATGIGYPYAFTFFSESMESKIFLACMLTIGLVLSFICIKRIQSIQNQTDKHYQYMEEYRKSNQ